MPENSLSTHSMFSSPFIGIPSSATQDSRAPVSAVNHLPGTRSTSSLDCQHGETSVTSPRNSPPPAFLLDDDPFANLTPVQEVGSSRPIPRPTPRHTSSSSSTSPLAALVTPRSPLSEARAVAFTRSRSIHTLPSGISRTLSGRTRPAYQKPAFAPRPSLPSLDTLAKMDVIFRPKVRKGRVGAGLPFEPWDNVQNPQAPAESASCLQDQNPPSGLPEPDLSVAPYSVTDHDSCFADLSSDEDITDGPTALQQGPSLESLCEADSDSSADTTTSHFAASEVPILTRSPSHSSVTSLEAYLWPTYLGNDNNISSTESDSDMLSSPPDDCFSFSTSRHSPDANADIDMSILFHEQLHTANDIAGAFYSHDNLSGILEPGYEPGTTPEIIWPSFKLKLNALSSSTDLPTDEDEVVEGGGWETGHERTGGMRIFPSGQTFGHGGSGWQNSTGGSGGGHFNGGGRGHGREDDDDDGRRRPYQSLFSTTSESDMSDDTEDESGDDYGERSEQGGQTGSGISSEDDVPLAQRIPTALLAQRTIRRQVREEREQRRKERALRAGNEVLSARKRQLTLRPGPAGAVDSARQGIHDAVVQASKQVGRPRTKTLPSGPRPFSPEDLSRRLQNVEAAGRVGRAMHPNHHSRNPSSPIQNLPKDSKPESFNLANRGVQSDELVKSMSPTLSNPLPKGQRALRPMKSFVLPRKKPDDYHLPAMPTSTDVEKLGSSLTQFQPHEKPTDTQNTIAQPVPASQERTLLTKSPEEPRKLTKARMEPKATRASSEAERPSHSNTQRPSVSSHPSPEISTTSRGQAVQQRIFIVDKQRFSVVEIGPSTSAGDVIEITQAQGLLNGWAGSGGWMIWEVSQDLGMERPIRSYELLSEIQASWSQEMSNAFVIKLTPLAVPLSRTAIPSSSPIHSGYVEWESKRGKWNKRWLQLREHSLWISKRGDGKDQVCLCSLSNFDGYFITRLYKAPRPFVFAVKSTDKLSFFENTADYLHVFSCSEKEGRTWMDNILIARSYVLHQERHVLFGSKPSNSSNTPTSLTRAGTRKGAPSRPAQPLVAVSAPYNATTAHTNDVFEPGSLLYKQP